MESIVADLQQQVADAIETGLTDSDGQQRAKVELLFTDDEVELSEEIADREYRVGRIPHVFVWAGSLVFQGDDTTKQMIQTEVPIRCFVATRDNSSRDQERQYRKVSKWCVYVASALAGQPIRVQGSNRGYLEDINVEPVFNIEEFALWEVRVTVPINIDTEVILNQIDNE